MKNKITLKEFFESKEELAIHCDTEEKANKLLKEFDKLGEKWCSGISYLQKNNYELYKDKTCYSNHGEYCEIEFYKDENYKIYSFEDIIFEENKPKNLIPEIAKMLGVGIGEEFGVIEQGYTKYKLDLANGLMYFDEDRNIWIRTSSTLNELLCSSNTIKKLPKKPQLTDAERVILQNVPKEYKWVARNEYNTLIIYSEKPNKTYIWDITKTTERRFELGLFKHLFQFIKWEDDEPYNIEELLKGE